GRHVEMASGTQYPKPVQLGGSVQMARSSACSTAHHFSLMRRRKAVRTESACGEWTMVRALLMILRRCQEAPLVPKLRENVAKRLADTVNRRNMEPNLEVSLLTGGGDRPYAFGLATELMSKRVALDIVGSDELDSPEFHGQPGVEFLNLRGDQSSSAGLLQ